MNLHELRINIGRLIKKFYLTVKRDFFLFDVKKRKTMFDEIKITIIGIILIVGVLASSILKILPNLPIEIPFDYVTISLTLAGLLIVTSEIGKRKALYPIAKDYIFSGISYIILYSIVLIANTESRTKILDLTINQIGLQIVDVIVLASWFLGSIFFVRATNELMRKLMKS